MPQFQGRRRQRHTIGPYRQVMAMWFLVTILGCATLPSREDLALSLSQMTDAALIQEIQATDAKLTQLGVSAQYLALTRPAPVYTLTGSSFYTGTFWRYGNVGHFTFQGQAIYQLTPNYGTQLGYAIGQAIIAGRINKTLRYRTALINEVTARTARREAESRTTVENFYQVHTDLRGHEGLVACLAPWVQRESEGLGTPELLNAIAGRVRSSIGASRENVSGEWYGLIVEEITYPDGRKNPFWLPARARLVQSGEGLVGVGELFNGEQLALQAKLGDGALQGTVLNATYNLAFEFTGQMTSDTMVVDFRSERQGTRFIGRAVMVR